MEKINLGNGWLGLGFLLYSLFVSLEANAQENNYWSVHQGTVGALNGGAVISNDKNLSAAYYNPGILPFVRSSSVSINVLSYFINNVDIENGAGEGLNLDNRYAGVIPQNVFGILMAKDSSKWTFSYAALSQVYSNLRFSVRQEADLDLISDRDETEHYLANFRYSNNLKENWVGFSAAYKINEKWGIGISAFGVVRSMQYDLLQEANAIAVNSDPSFYRTIATSNLNESITYVGFGLLCKLGVSYQLERLKLGFTFTSPLLNVDFIGKGFMTRSVYVSSDVLTESNVRSTTDQKNVNTRLKKPLTLDFGASYLFHKTELSLRVAYYSAINTYDMIHREDLSSSSIFDGGAAFGVPQMANKAVVNFGLGVIQKLTTNTSLYLGFNTDFNNFDKNAIIESQDFVPTVDYWDLYQYAAGLSHRLKSYELIYGLSYSRGRSKGDNQIVNLSDPQEDLFLFGEKTNSANTKVDRVNLHIGFAFYY
ncbi:hypothetical protein [Reichenbachiella sp.]|uniref:hypothetical protein n=1 Tax=Reichenbachiella sp. TaxID=2184521 RepID=UPI003B5C0FE3